MASHISEGHIDLIFGVPTENEGSMTFWIFIKHHPQYITKDYSTILRGRETPNHLSDSITTVGLWCRFVWYIVTEVS